MNISTFVNISSMLPPEIAILLRAQTGVGKSSIVSQIAQSIDLPLIDVRGSTMSEGDVIGYPDIEGMKSSKVMSFCMPSWFKRACKEPVVLFLDELNRSLPTVQQAFFQIVLNRCLGNDENGMPYKIHPETRVFAAINHGNEYDVNDIDPALLRRFWTVDLSVSTTDWLSWAKQNNIPEIVTEFIKTREEHLAPDPANINPGNVFPTPASWARLNESLVYSNFDLNNKTEENMSTLYNLCVGFLGIETTIEFTDYVKKYEIDIKPEDLLRSFDECLPKIRKMSNDRINSLIERLGEHSANNDWSPIHAENAAKLGKYISEEMLIHMWSVITSKKNINTIQAFHHFIGEYLVDVVQNSKNLDK